MDDSIDLAISLKNSVLNSDFYKKYIDCKNILANNFELYEIVKNFRKRQLNFNYKSKNNIEISIDEELELSKIYSDLILNDDVKKFFDSEKIFYENFNKILCILNEEFDNITL